MRMTALTSLLVVSLCASACAPAEDEEHFEETTVEVGDGKADGEFTRWLDFTPGVAWKAYLHCREHVLCDVNTVFDMPGSDLAPYVRQYFADHPSADTWVIDGLIDVTLGSASEDAQGEWRAHGRTRHTITRRGNGRYDLRTEILQDLGPNGTLAVLGTEGSVAAEFAPDTTVVAVVRLDRSKLLYPSSETLHVIFVSSWY
jgi:hypothetical protein